MAVEEPVQTDQATTEQSAPAVTAPAPSPAPADSAAPVQPAQSGSSENNADIAKKGEEQAGGTVDDPTINFYNFIDEGNNPDSSAKPEEASELDPEDLVPEEYDFSNLTPELGEAMSEKDTAFVSSLSKELKLTNRQAKKLFEIGSSRVYKEQIAYRDELAKQWLETVKADEEIGGANFNETRANIRRAISKYGSKDVVDIFNQTKLSYYPAVMRMLNKIGADISEERNFVGGTPVKAKGNSWRAVYNNSPELKF